MKHLVTALALVFTAPSLAAAQTASPDVAPAVQHAPASVAAPVLAPTLPTVRTQMTAGFAFLAEASRTQSQARASMLGALTPAHRALVAEIVGELAIAPQPNFDAAAARLDAALRPAEVAGIGHALAIERADSVAAFGQIKSTLDRSLTPDQLKQANDTNAQVTHVLASGAMMPEIEKIAHDAADPGHVLLQAVLLGVQPYNRFFSGPMPRMTSP